MELENRRKRWPLLKEIAAKNWGEKLKVEKWMKKWAFMKNILKENGPEKLCQKMGEIV